MCLVLGKQAKQNNWVLTNVILFPIQASSREQDPGGVLSCFSQLPRCESSTLLDVLSSNSTGLHCDSSVSFQLLRSRCMQHKTQQNKPQQNKPRPKQGTAKQARAKQGLFALACFQAVHQSPTWWTRREICQSGHVKQ